MRRAAFAPLAAACAALLAACATAGPSVPPEDYYSLGTAYFELKRYAEAEKYFSLAARDVKTRPAAEYQLARIQYERGDSEGAARRFERLLEADPENTLALRAAAYSWMKAGRHEDAIRLYGRLDLLLPESTDARLNYAIALAESGRLDEAVERVLPYLERKPEDRDTQLFAARTERKLSRPEAIDRYKTALELKDEASVRVEYAEALEAQGFYARAVENYDKVISAGLTANASLSPAAVRFALARSLLIAGEAERGVAELEAALKDGFADREALSALAADEQIASGEQVRTIVDGALAAEAPKDR